MALVLPRYVVLKSAYNSKYLRYIYEGTELNRFLVFDGEEIVSPHSKFAVEIAKCNRGLVHIRCCYTNKYWVRNSVHEDWIVAAAKTPEEDQSKWSCTLFKPIYVDGDAKTVRFVHVQLGHHACLWRGGDAKYCCIVARWADDDADKCDVFNIIDWETLVIFPKNVAFKGDNGYYLHARDGFLQFSASDIGDSTVRNEIFTNFDGTIRIKYTSNGGFYRRSPNWIWPDSYDTTCNNADTLYWPVKVGDGTVALRSLGNNLFCSRLSDQWYQDCLNANDTTITKEARIDVEELVILRKIYNVDFHLDDARIYNESIIMLTHAVGTNNSHESNEHQFTFEHVEEQLKAWNSSCSFKLGLEMQFQSGVPAVESTSIKITTEFVGTYSWGKTDKSSNKVTSTYKTTIPQRTKMTVYIIATQGTYDVPFSYYQTDTNTDGTITTYYKTDGVYTGTNCYNITYDVKEEKLDP